MLESGSFFIPYIGINYAAVSKQHVKRAAVVSKIAYTEGGSSVCGRTAIIRNLQKIQTAGRVDNGYRRDGIGLERHRFLDIDIAIRACDSDGLITGGNPAIAADSGIVQKIDYTTAIDEDTEGPVAESRIQKANLGGLRPHRDDGTALTRIGKRNKRGESAWRHRAAFAGIGKRNNGRIAAAWRGRATFTGVGQRNDGSIAAAWRGRAAFAGVGQGNNWSIAAASRSCGPTLPGIGKGSHRGIRTTSILHISTSRKQ